MKALKKTKNRLKQVKIVLIKEKLFNKVKAQSLRILNKN